MLFGWLGSQRPLLFQSFFIGRGFHAIQADVGLNVCHCVAHLGLTVAYWLGHFPKSFQ